MAWASDLRPADYLGDVREACKCAALAGFPPEVSTMLACQRRGLEQPGKGGAHGVHVRLRGSGHRADAHRSGCWRAAASPPAPKPPLVVCSCKSSQDVFSKEYEMCDGAMEFESRSGSRRSPTVQLRAQLAVPADQPTQERRLPKAGRVFGRGGISSFASRPSFSSAACRPAAGDGPVHVRRRLATNGRWSSAPRSRITTEAAGAS